MLVVSPKKVTPSNLNLNSEEVNWLKQDFPNAYNIYLRKLGGKPIVPQYERGDV